MKGRESLADQLHQVRPSVRTTGDQPTGGIGVDPVPPVSSAKQQSVFEPKPIAVAPTTHGHAAQAIQPQASPVQKGNHMSGQQQSSLSAFFGGTFGGINRNAPGDILKKALEKAQAAAKGVLNTSEYDCSVELLDENNYAVPGAPVSGRPLYPSLIVAVFDSTIGRVAYHTILIAQEIELPPLQETLAGGQIVSIKQLPSDVNNGVYYDIVLNYITNKYPKVGEPIYANASLIPASVNLEDDSMMRQMIINALEASVMKLNDYRGSARRTVILTPPAPGESLQASVDINCPATVDITGIPVRTDTILRTTISSQGSNGQRSTLNTQNGVRQVATIGGYIDLAWLPVTQQEQFANMNMGYYPGAPMPAPTQKFLARFIMTMMAGEVRTLEAQLLAMATCALITEGNNWWPLLDDRGAAHSGVRLRDPGALNIEGNLEGNGNGAGYGVAPATGSVSFTQADLGDMISKLVRPQIMPALSIPECGTLSWANAVFLAASQGIVDAVDAIKAAADTLTNGRYSALGGGRNPLIYVVGDDNAVERVHAGYTIDDNGAKVPLAVMDYLAVMNLIGHQDPTVGKRWTDTFSDYSRPLIARLADRENMIKELTSGRAKFTGYERVVNIDPNELSILARAISDNGLKLRAGGALDAGQFNNMRAVYGWVPQGHLPRQASGLFTSGTGPQTARTIPGAGFPYRF